MNQIIIRSSRDCFFIISIVSHYGDIRDSIENGYKHSRIHIKNLYDAE